MSKRFFFDVSDGEEFIADKAGAEAATLDQAIAEARSVIAETADEVVGSDPDRHWTLIVRDEAGSIVERLPIKRQTSM